VEDENRDWVEAKHGRSAKEWWSANHLLPPFLLSPPLRPSMAGRPKIGGRPATFSLLSFFPLHYLPLSSTTTPLGQNGGALATWAVGSATILGQSATPWFPYKRLAKGSLLLHPTSS
jgi:hypothetical protein